MWCIHEVSLNLPGVKIVVLAISLVLEWMLEQKATFCNMEVIAV